MRLRDSRIIALPLLVLLVLGWSSEVFAGKLVIGGERVVPGRSVFPHGSALTIHVVDDRGLPVVGVEVTATYKPGTKLANTEVAGKTDGQGVLRWTPTASGLLTLAADSVDANASLSIQYESFPGSGLVILILVGLLYFGVGGGLVLSLARG